MKKVAHILIGLFITAVILLIVVPLAGYVMLSTSWSQEHLRATAEQALERALGTRVQISSVRFDPFNRLKILGLTIEDDYGRKAISAREIDARVELADFIFSGDMALDYAVVDGLNARISRKEPGAPLNIANIIANLSSDEEKKEQARFDFRLDNIQLLHSTLQYDVLSEPIDSGRFSPSHARLDDVNVYVYAPELSNDAYGVRLKHLSFVERSGFTVKDVSVSVRLDQRRLSVSDFVISLPNSRLALGKIEADIPGIDSVGGVGTIYPVNISVKPGSTLYPPDFKAFEPRLASLDDQVGIELDAAGVADSIFIKSMTIADGSGCISADVNGTLLGLANPAKARAKDLSLDVSVCRKPVSWAMANFGQKAPSKTLKLIEAIGDVRASGWIDGSIDDCDLAISAETSSGAVSVTGRAGYADGFAHANAAIQASSLDLGALLQSPALGKLTAKAKGYIALRGGDATGQASIEAGSLQLLGYEYHDLTLEATANSSEKKAEARCDDPNASFRISASADFNRAKELEGFSIAGKINRLAIDSLGLSNAYPGYALSTAFDAEANGESLRKFVGNASIQNLAFANSKGEGLKVGDFQVSADNVSQGMHELSVSSDFLNGALQGSYDLLDIWPDIRDIICETFPVLSAPLKYQTGIDWQSENNFAYDFTLANALDISTFFKLPVQLTDPISISGELFQSRRRFTLELDAPWMLQGDKVIEGTSAYVSVDAAEALAQAYACTLMPTKKGPMNLVVDISGGGSKLDTNVDWEIIREQPINGKFEIDTEIMAEADNSLSALVSFLPGEINFGSEAWKLGASQILASKDRIDVDNFNMVCDDQSIGIDGIVSSDPDDELLVNLDNVQLVDIFETLEIDKALICGWATGQISASGLFSSEPRIITNYLHVKDMGYNYCVIGDGEVQAWFDNERQSFNFDGDLLSAENRHSRITGYIVPSTEEIELFINADRAKVGFMQPFMQAFCSGVQGYASGYAHLFGTFSFIDMEGDLYAQDLKLKIDFTDAWYSATDSIHITPGRINLDNITIRDAYGHTANLNGCVNHIFFKQPSFDIRITDARDFLCYDVKKENSPRWHGTIFGNGTAAIKGEPGVVNISTNMATARGSSFTFELSDMEVAQEYQFITFRDLTPPPADLDPILQAQTPSMAEQIASRLRGDDNGDDNPTAYNLDIAVDITPETKVVLVMDPVGHDDITCYGSGHLRLTYGSANEDLALFGEYKLDQGEYDFGLQDIIRRKFTIEKDSKISFSGNPYQAQLDITAFYEVKGANLSDLDESFLNDKELTRTRVPVHAIMKVQGNMRQPDISFALKLPTLNADVERKVLSIVSTTDMMNMQIIYLLALNRFYTPDYMAATRGNELFSAASSTISSQLSSILGKLSDNWSIAPNLRSDRGDFSDLEVDVTLQSNLLNNRLLLNGNLGYRDKSLNTNQFIGDFDAEYLLNRPGTLRVKGYSRYNDQNYYLRSANTTQGIGFVVRRDFDSLLPSFLRKKPATEPQPEDKE